MLRKPNLLRSIGLTRKPTMMLALAADNLGQGAPAGLRNGRD